MSGKQPKKKPYVYQTDAAVLNRAFYEAFDSTFLAHKAEPLWLVAREREAFTQLVSSVEQRDAQLTDSFFAGLRAEIHFTEIHQMEVLFALLLAAFQDLPHRVYLTDYQTRDIVAAVKLFTRGSVSAVTDGRVKSGQDFVQWAVYTGYAVVDEGDDESERRWAANLENVTWLLLRFGGKYLDSLPEYNAYKHGLRVTATGPAWFRLRPEGSTGPGFARSSDDALRYLEVKSLPTGEKVQYDQLKLFTIKECMDNLRMMQKILSTVRATRLAHLYDEPSPEIFWFLDLDREALLQQGVNNSKFGMQI